MHSVGSRIQEVFREVYATKGPTIRAIRSAHMCENRKPQRVSSSSNDANLIFFSRPDIMQSQKKTSTETLNISKGSSYTMKRFKMISLVSITVVFLLGGALALVWANDAPELSGITVEDKYPNGCIDCHNDAGGEEIRRLDVILEELDHTNVSALTKIVPDDCARCHKEGTSIGGLNKQTHRIHYENPSENDFIDDFQGECLACHALNSATGEVTTKSGLKNW